MKRLIIAGILVALHHECPAAQIDEQRLVDAIYKAEGGAKARVPYGILSVSVHSTAEARAACERTIHHNLTSWRSNGSQGDPIVWIASTYCPASDDPAGHRNWIRNVRWIYEHS